MFISDLPSCGSNSSHSVYGDKDSAIFKTAFADAPSLKQSRVNFSISAGLSAYLAPI
ncbi:hypothetical protein CAMRE0001_1432 [Campylobacter rectus RM3267]|uniref:Uncharacterized protein n=1 Tax=Campylobacter rectus RM3267 TaxID=553218 RepID=B9D0B1_CAMRE|nr:hypothetical protein [Campylobacter rectus]EEF14671.1 hypothetical protein CAMRE0001_1432 [Campylobacter rectus RM3267]UEB48572.1 hypothetical protein LK437_04485 [Campylobacter rectus]